MIVDGKQQYLFDDKGRRYLDVSTSCLPVADVPASQRPPQLTWVLPPPPLRRRRLPPALSPPACPWPPQRPSDPVTAPPLQAFAGIVTVSVGHCHPEVNRAVIQQTQRLQVRLVLCCGVLSCPVLCWPLRGAHCCRSVRPAALQLHTRPLLLAWPCRLAAASRASSTPPPSTCTPKSPSTPRS